MSLCEVVVLSPGEGSQGAGDRRRAVQDGAGPGLLRPRISLCLCDCGLLTAGPLPPGRLRGVTSILRTLVMAGHQEELGGDLSGHCADQLENMASHSTSKFLFRAFQTQDLGNNILLSRDNLR